MNTANSSSHGSNLFEKPIISAKNREMVVNSRCMSGEKIKQEMTSCHFYLQKSKNLGYLTCSYVRVNIVRFILFVLLICCECDKSQTRH